MGASRRKKYDAFISYPGELRYWVEKLRYGLERVGLRVFVDYLELESPDLITSQLQNGLGLSKRLLLLVSPESAASLWVELEKESFGRARVLPLVVGPSPKGFLRKLHNKRRWSPPIDFSRIVKERPMTSSVAYRKKYIASFEELVAKLRKTASVPRKELRRLWSEPNTVPRAPSYAIADDLYREALGLIAELLHNRVMLYGFWSRFGLDRRGTEQYFQDGLTLEDREVLANRLLVQLSRSEKLPMARVICNVLEAWTAPAGDRLGRKIEKLLGRLRLVIDPTIEDELVTSVRAAIGEDRYQVHRAIGGRRNTVILGEDLNLRRRVVVKPLHPAIVREDEHGHARREFLESVVCASKLRSDSFLHIHGARSFRTRLQQSEKKEEWTCLYICEFLEGFTTLAEVFFHCRVNGIRIHKGDVDCLCDKLHGAVDELTRLGLTHAYIQADNIFVAHDEHGLAVKISPLGVVEKGRAAGFARHYARSEASIDAHASVRRVLEANAEIARRVGRKVRKPRLSKLLADIKADKEEAKELSYQLFKSAPEVLNQEFLELFRRHFWRKPDVKARFDVAGTQAGMYVDQIREALEAVAIYGIRRSLASQGLTARATDGYHIDLGDLDYRHFREAFDETLAESRGRLTPEQRNAWSYFVTYVTNYMLFKQDAD